MNKIYYCQNCKRWRGNNKECPECGEETAEREVPKARGDYYFIDEVDKPLKRVTTVIDEVLHKEGLEYWKRKTSVEAALETLDFDKAMAAIYEKRDEAAKSGSDLHNIVENILKGGDVNWDQAKKIPKIRGFLKFYKDFDWEKTIFAERTTWDEELGIAGTADAGIVKEGDNILVDWKTGNNVYPTVQLQLSAYDHMLDIDFDRLLVVHLKEDAYDLHEYEPNFKPYKGLLWAARWKENN